MVGKRVAVLCIVVFNLTLHIRMWLLGIDLVDTWVLGPYYDEVWTTVWVVVALLLASSIRRAARDDRGSPTS